MQNTEQKLTKVTFQFKDESQLALVFKSDRTVKSLKEELVNYTWAEENKIVLALVQEGSDEHKYLSNGETKIGEVGNGVDIKIVVEGANRNFAFSDLKTKDQQNTFVTLNPKDVMIVGEGLNFHSVCINPKCEANGKVIRVHKGFDQKFNIAKQINKCQCPLCKIQAAKATNFGFFRCKVEIQGQKITDQIFNDKFVTKNDLYHTFLEKNNQGLINWSYLQVKAQKL